MLFLKFHMTHPARVLCFILALGVLTLSACQPKTPAPPPRLPAPQEVAPADARLPTAELAAEAQRAWERGKTARSLALFTELARRPDAPNQADAFASAMSSALQLDDPATALSLAREWQTTLPEAEAEAQYQDLYGRALMDARMDAVFADHFGALAEDDDPDLRRLAMAQLAEWGVVRERRDEARSLVDPLLEELRDNPEELGAAQTAIVRRVAALPPDNQRAVLEDFTRPALAEEGELRPLVGLGAALGLANLEPDTVSAAFTPLRRALESVTDPLLRQDLIENLGQAMGPLTPKVALALPLSGRFGSVGSRVLSGARLALDRLAARDLDGLAPELLIVNTDAEGWATRLGAMDASVVGGPLVVNDFKQLKAAGVHRSKAVFAFLPSLGELNEGQDAWRFFGSPRDQADALLRLASFDLGVESVGILAPEEPYGESFSSVFRQSAEDVGVNVAASHTYPPDDPTVWGKSVKTLLYGPEAGKTGRPLKVPGDIPFGAVFIPDSLIQARQLAPLFHLHDAEHLLLLGPSLWSRPGASIQSMERTYFRLATAPLAFDPASDAPGTRGLVSAARDAGIENVDFWTALGYDFIRLAAALGPLELPANPERVNERLKSLPGLDFALAPVMWDDDGRARQQLFVVQPTPSGPRAASSERLLLRLIRAGEGRSERAEKLREEERLKLEEAGLLPADPAAVPDPQPAGQPATSAPQGEIQ